MLPRIKEDRLKEGRFTFETLVFPPLCNGFEKCVEALLKAFNVRVGLFWSFDGEPSVIVRKIENDHSEYYEISVNRESAEIRYTDELSFRNAVVTLLTLIKKEENGFYIECRDLRDWPDSAYRGIMIDLARKYLPTEILHCELRTAAFAKYNAVHLRLLDAERLALKSEAASELNTDNIRQYTAAQLRELDEYAASLGLKVVPEIDFPAHAITVLEKFPELHCERDGEKLGIWTACVSEEKLYVLIGKLVKELCGIFKGEYIHIGGDELGFRDLTELKRWAYWEQCDKCRLVMEENGYKDESDLFCHFIRRVYKIVVGCGKKLAMWNDSVDISRSPDLPRDILIFFWRIAYPGRGPHIGCSLDRWLEEGFRIVNCFFEETYLDDFLVEDKLCKWNPRSSPSIKRENEKGIIGGQLNIFEVKHHYGYTVPSAIVICGDRLWNHCAITDFKSAAADLNHQLISIEKGAPAFFATLNTLVFGTNRPCPYSEIKVCRKELSELHDKLLRAFYSGYCEELILREYVWVVNALLLTAEGDAMNPPKNENA